MKLRSTLSSQLILVVVARFSQLSLADNSDFKIIQQTSSTIAAYSVTVDPSDQSFYVYGRPSLSQLSLSKYRNDGTQIWLTIFGNNTLAFDSVGSLKTFWILANRPVIDVRTGDIFVHGWTTGSFGGQLITPRLGASATTSSLFQSNAGGFSPYWWSSVAWSPELGRFMVVCSYNYFGVYPVLVSTNGANWNLITSGTMTNPFTSVVWAGSLGLFVAVASDGYVMTTSTGNSSFTRVTPTALNAWQSITWAPGLSLLVAVANSGTTQRVMTSSNGSTWFLRTAAADLDWRSVCWSGEVGRFVAVGTSGAVMTSNNGIDWANRTAAANNDWQSVIWVKQLGMFVAVASSGIGNQIMASPDGISWTTRKSPADSQWKCITYSPEIGILLAIAANNNQIIFSQDGINWSTRSLGSTDTFTSVVWAPSRRVFVATGYTPVQYSNNSDTYGRIQTISTSAISDTPFVVRFNSSGSLVTTKFYEVSPGRGAAIAINGNRLYVAGTIAVGAAPDYDGYLTAINANDFSTLWSVQISTGLTADYISAMDIDQANGVIFLAGFTSGTFSGQTNQGGFDAFITRLNAVTGAFISTTLQIGSDGDDYVMNFILDPYRSAMYIVGNTGGAAINFVNRTGNTQDQWMSAYNSTNSAHMWTKIIGGTNEYDTAYDVAVHPLTKGVYLVGCATNVQPPNYGDLDLNLALLSPAGALSWIKSAGALRSDYGFGTAFTANGSLIIAGRFNETAALFFYTADSNSLFVPNASTTLSSTSSYLTENSSSIIVTISPTKEGGSNPPVDFLSNSLFLGLLIGGCALLLLVSSAAFLLFRKRRQAKKASPTVKYYFSPAARTAQLSLSQTGAEAFNPVVYYTSHSPPQNVCTPTNFIGTLYGQTQNYNRTAVLDDSLYDEAHQQHKPTNVQRFLYKKDNLIA